MDPSDFKKLTLDCNNDTGIQKNRSSKRQEYLGWDEYFMGIAFLAAKRSKDPNTQVGACIVDENKRIVGIGYNGFPWGCSDDEFTWGKADSQDKSEETETKFLYVCHAELNAVLNKNTASLKNSSIYVALFPCNECAKVIIQSEIKEVIYVSDKNAHKLSNIAAKKMFDAAKVGYRQFIPKQNEIVIDFSKLNDQSNLKN